MRILITGASGFVGQNLLPYLSSEFPDVEYVYVVRNKKRERNEVLWQELDKIRDDNINAVIHLAGLAHDTRNTLNDDAYFLVNYELTKQLYDWFLKSKAEKFIFVSSVKAAADHVPHVLTEAVVPGPVTAYGKSKLKAEEYIKQLSLGLEHKHFYILRPCMIHGPGNKGNLNLFYKFILKGLPYPLGAFRNERSFLSIRNFCFVIHQLLTKPVESGIYNLADDKALSTSELFQLIAETSGKRARVWNIPAVGIEKLAILGDKLRLPLNTERLNKLTENYVVSNEKIKHALLIDKMPMSAEEGIRTTIQSFNSK